MRLGFVVAAFAVPIALAGPAGAADRFGDPYVGLKGIGAYATIDDVSANGFAGPQQIENDDDFTAGVGGVVGWRFFRIPLRMEVEGGYRFRFDLDNRDLAPAGTIDYETNIATAQVIINAILDWRNSSSFTPYVGVSLGWAGHDVETQRTNLPTQVQQNQDEWVNNVAWGAMIGVDWAFTENWNAGLAFRYLNLGDIDTGSFSTGESIETGDYHSFDVILSVGYVF